MAKQHGKNASFWLDNAAGALQDLSNFCDNVELPRDASLEEVTSFGDGGVKTIPGLENSTITVSGAWDPTFAAHVEAIFQHANTQTFEYGPEGASSGDRKLSGECRIASFSTSSPVAGRVEFSLEIQVDGVVTAGTFA